jgi:uncharacterized repeat protein (TIGR01451 family)
MGNGRMKSVFGGLGRFWVFGMATLIAMAGVVALPAVAHADTLVGCDTAGLVAAINGANTAGGGTLDLAVGCTYKLTSGSLPTVTTPITIHGNGATIERVATAPQFRLIAVSSYSGSLTADALTLTGGNDPAGDGGGGGIYASLGTVSLTDCTVSGNVASGYGQGGGILNGGTVVLTSSTVSGNTAGSPGGGGGTGGGVANDGSLTVTKSTISGNTAYAYGGGIYSDKYTYLSVSNSTIAGNNTIYPLSESGGGIRVDSVDGTVLLNSTISGNVAGSSNNGAASGGGVAIGSNAAGGTMNLTNITISGNAATSAAGILVDAGTVNLTASTISGNSASGSGGGVVNNGGAVNLTNSTISGNSAGGSGGGVDNGATVTLTYSTVFGNTSSAASGGGIFNGGTVTTSSSIVAGNPGGNCSNAVLSSGGYNVDGDGTCGLTAATDQNNVDPQLGPLQANGGPTETMAPASTSPVVDAVPKGTNGCGTTIKTDERGVLRPQGAGCDTGAYETGDVAMQALVAKPKSVVSGANVTYTATVVNAGAVDATGVVVTDTLPAGLSFTSATASQGSCSFVPPTLTCTLGQFAAAATAKVKVIVKVTAAASTTITDTATVSATTGDTIAGNGSKAVKVKVT